MRLFKLKTNLPVIQKIALAAVFISLIAVLQKVVAVNYIPGLPFFRISFGGPALIVFSSILLGPWYGLLVGGASDVLGYFIFDMSGSAWFPQITAIYALLGFVSYFIFELVVNIKNRKICFAIECASFTIFTGLILAYFLTDPEAEMWAKIVFPCSALLLSILLIIFIIIFDKKVKLEFNYNAFQISFCSFILEAFIMLGFGSLMKACAFGFEIYKLIFVCQMLVLFVNVTINTVLVPILFKFTKKYFIVKN